MLCVTVVGFVLTGDAIFHYFIAARQFVWVLPEVAILAASAIDRRGRIAGIAAICLMLVCIRQSAVFFRSPQENWQAAADALLMQSSQGACLAVTPPDQIRLYRFFHPELGRGSCTGDRVVVAITPYATAAQRRAELTTARAAAYQEGKQHEIGGSDIITFERHQVRE